ncbi:hypothetical protein KV112_21880 [Mycolicibacter sp. MYC123]|uniref:Uncharacterized protein n=1 Tax=[Mycobacterium] zoologicum TaxID=2872311 RepID=A0ABU5YR72_9MYCO|nr:MULTISPECIES: hypothetical protein [unclassified Mycolicibacter]MEB3052346.1 hypothetical protein [Mycolicibacter sp. MYC123]MEB3062225.1 hypothetical protein [Mycolicibacter sp. MYC101]
MILGTVGAVVLIALAGGVAIFLHGRGTTAGQSGSDGHWTETSKTLPAPAPAPAPVVLPAGAVECGVSAGGTYRGAAKGTDSTSCPFVENVRDAFNNAGGQVPTVVEAYSPVTGKHYQMSCAMEQVITCRGGVNAVVYVYEKAGATGAPAASAPATNALPSDAMIFEALKQSGVSAHDLAQYAIVSKSAPTSGWYVAEIRRTDMQLEHAYAIFRDNSPPDGHLKWVAGPGTSFPSQYFSFPDEVRQVLPSGYS